jgi:phosphatidylglycerol:prolipoprotein diacylglycerol transferase
MLPILNIGPLAIQFPGLILLVGIWLGMAWTDKSAQRYNLNSNRILNALLIAVLFGFAAARIAYIIQFPQAFKANPFAVFALKTDMLDTFAGVTFGIIAAFIYLQRQQIPFWSLMDSLTSLMAAFMIALGFSQLASGDAFGAPADLPWSIFLWGSDRHPSQVYAILVSIPIAIFTAPSRRFINISPTGTRFLLFIAATTLARLFLETFRGDSLSIFGNFRLAQILSWGILALSLYLLHNRFLVSSEGTELKG